MISQICEIAQLGAGVLRQIAEPVFDLNDPEVKAIITAMHSTLASSQGVGLAAPQIGHSRQIIIVASRPNVRYPNAPLMVPTLMINPVYSALSDIKEKGWEGCLSIPGIRALVPRYKSIHISYTDESGKPVEQELHDFVARIFQHEADHLQGLVYLDRVEVSTDIITESEYLKLLA